jgi:hypothetical protein
MAMAGGPTVITVGSKPTVQAPDHALERRWDAIERKLATNAERLAAQGGLVAMKSASGRRAWAVRFVDVVDGRKVHRSVYVGGDDRPELLARTRRWLDHCRVKGRVADDVAGYARLAAAACGAVRRLHPSLVPRRR